MCSMLHCRMCIVIKDNRNLSFGCYLKEREVNKDKPRYLAFM